MKWASAASNSNQQTEPPQREEASISGSIHTSINHILKRGTATIAATIACGNHRRAA